LVPPRHPFTFEATPDYLFYPGAAERAATIVPHAKILVLLRDPVERAYSHFRHMVRLGFETLSFEEALEAEESRIAPDIEAMQRNPTHYCRPFVHFSYASRGLYAEQLRRWLDHFPRDQFCFIRSEDFFSDPSTTYARVLEFLNLPPWKPPMFRNYTGAPAGSKGNDLSPSARNRLSAFYERDQEWLRALLGPAFNWRDDPVPPHSSSVTRLSPA
jgi:hypothetical protein